MRNQYGYIKYYQYIDKSSVFLSIMASFTHYKVGATEQTPILSEGSPSMDEMKIKVLSLTKDEMIFDLMGVDASIANALRRILIAEVRCRVIVHFFS